MATGGKLEVQIGADITDFEKKIKEVEFDIKELSKVKLDRIKLGLDTREINSQIKDAKNNLTQLKTAVKDTGQSFAQATPKIANGGNTLMQFSRIAQDAPFGIMGIGNNITATAESFSYLKQQTGSTGGALKALASSIAGTGGILLGVSLLTTGLTLLSQSGLSVGDVIDKLTGDFDEFGAELKKANEEGIKSASTQINLMNTLIAVAQNDNRTKADRIDAVKQLKAEFPEYYKQLSDEKIMYGDLSKETKNATKALLAKAVADKLASKNADVFEQKLLAQGRYNKKRAELAEFDIKTEKELAAIRKQIANNPSGGAGQAEAAILYNRGKILDSLEDESKLIGALDKKYANLLNVIDEIYDPEKPRELPATKTTKATKSPKIKNAKFEFDTEFIAPFISQISGLGATMDGFAERTAIAFDNANASTKIGLSEMALAWETFGLNLSDIIESGVESTLISFGETLGTALTEGINVVDALGQSLIGSIGQTISAVGKELVKMGILAQAYAAVVKFMQKAFTNPYALAAAGVALVVIGSAVSASAKKVGSGGSGGGASTSTGAGANNESFSRSSFSGTSANSGTVVFEIAGTKLVGVLSNTLNANRRLGGQLGLG
jgi:hypothetical protein